MRKIIKIRAQIYGIETKKRKKKTYKESTKKTKLAEEFQRVVEWQESVSTEMAVKTLGQGTADPGCWKNYREKN
jgi:hypothetical protein